MTSPSGPLASDLGRLSNAEIASARERALAKLTSRARTAAFALAEGNSAKDAARMAGLSPHPSAVSRLQKRVAPALALLREELRRTSQETSESAARWFDELAAESREAGDRNAARSAKREACLLRGLYPDPRIRVEHEMIDTAEITAEEWQLLSCLKHEIRRQLPTTVTAAYTKVAPTVTSAQTSPSPVAAQLPGEPTRALSEEGNPADREAPDAP
jgi:hypothetical protein